MMKSSLILVVLAFFGSSTTTYAQGASGSQAGRGGSGSTLGTTVGQQTFISAITCDQFDSFEALEAAFADALVSTHGVASDEINAVSASCSNLGELELEALGQETGVVIDVIASLLLDEAVVAAIALSLESSGFSGPVSIDAGDGSFAEVVVGFVGTSSDVDTARDPCEAERREFEAITTTTTSTTTTTTTTTTTPEPTTAVFRAGVDTTISPKKSKKAKSNKRRHRERRKKEKKGKGDETVGTDPESLLRQCEEEYKVIFLSTCAVTCGNTFQNNNGIIVIGSSSSGGSSSKGKSGKSKSSSGKSGKSKSSGKSKKKGRFTLEKTAAAGGTQNSHAGYIAGGLIVVLAVGAAGLVLRKKKMSQGYEKVDFNIAVQACLDHEQFVEPTEDTPLFSSVAV